MMGEDYEKGYLHCNGLASKVEDRTASGVSAEELHNGEINRKGKIGRE